MPKKPTPPQSKAISKKKKSPPQKVASKKSSVSTTISNKKIETRIVELYKKNKALQVEINKAKKNYEALEKESLKLTKELMEAGYIPKDLTISK